MKTILLTSLFLIFRAECSLESPCYCLQTFVDVLQNPIYMMEITLGGQNLFLIAEQSGTIYEYNYAGDRKLKTYVDLSDKIVSGSEQGLLGFAAHPQFSVNERIYLYTIRNFTGRIYSFITEVTGKNIQSEKIILAIEQKGPKQNGGQLLFGHDGFLYIFLGDGGGSGSEAQDTSKLLGKVLRVDVNSQAIVNDKPQNYVIPPDNPSKTTRPGWRDEIFAIGIRHMWRCSVDRGDPESGDGAGRIFCSDLGDKTSESIDIIKKGMNYGWNFREGSICLNETRCASAENEEKPIYAFVRPSVVDALVGGPLYRGAAFPALKGNYIFGDFVSGKVFRLEKLSNASWTYDNFSVCLPSLCGCREQAKPLKHILSFGEDTNGEVYLLMTSDPYNTGKVGKIFKMVPKSQQRVTCGGNLIVSFKTTVLLFFMLSIMI